MVERKEPTLSSTPSDHNEPRAGRAAMTSAVTAERPRDGARNTREGRRDEPRDNSSRSKPAVPRTAAAPQSSAWTGLILILALAGLSLAGFAYWQLMAAQQELVAADRRLADLEKRLELTGDEANQSLTVLSAKLKEADSEIRKLWALVNDRNRKAIEANKVSIDKLVKDLATTKTSIAAARKLVDDQAKVLVALQTNATGAHDLAQQAVMDAELMKEELSTVVEQSNRSEKAVTSLQNSLTARVKANEEAIEAIDNYRLSVNRDLQAIKQRLNPGQ